MSAIPLLVSHFRQEKLRRSELTPCPKRPDLGYRVISTGIDLHWLEDGSYYGSLYFNPGYCDELVKIITVFLHDETFDELGISLNEVAWERGWAVAVPLQTEVYPPIWCAEIAIHPGEQLWETLSKDQCHVQN
jgi:hypothetical protein